MRDHRFDDEADGKVEKSDVWRKKRKARSWRGDDGGLTWREKLFVALLLAAFFFLGMYVMWDYYRPLIATMVPRAKLAEEVAKQPTTSLASIARGRRYTRLCPKWYFRSNVVWAADPKNRLREAYIHLAPEDMHDIQICAFLLHDCDLRSLARAVLRWRASRPPLQKKK